jgi:hypothetical protein
MAWKALGAILNQARRGAVFMVNSFRWLTMKSAYPLKTGELIAL